MDDLSTNLTILFFISLALLVTQLLVHRGLINLLYNFTGNGNLSVKLYAVIFFPGVIVHELSHAFVASILGANIKSFSLFPRISPEGDSIELGYVEYDPASNSAHGFSNFRKFLTGVAPLFAGSLTMLLLALLIINLIEPTSLKDAINSSDFIPVLKNLLGNGYFLVALYLFFAVGNTMMPSVSDVLSWIGFAIFLLGLLVIGNTIGLSLSLSFLSDELLSTLNIATMIWTILILIVVIINVVFLAGAVLLSFLTPHVIESSQVEY